MSADKWWNGWEGFLAFMHFWKPFMTKWQHCLVWLAWLQLLQTRKHWHRADHLMQYPWYWEAFHSVSEGMCRQLWATFCCITYSDTHWLSMVTSFPKHFAVYAYAVQCGSGSPKAVMLLAPFVPGYRPVYARTSHLSTLVFKCFAFSSRL